MNGDGETRDRLDEEIFSFQATRAGKVFIYWQGRQIKALRDEDAADFLRKMSAADARGAQLLMARVTGNFKRGNER